MPYNTTIGPPRRMEDYLKKLLERQESMRFAADRPSSLAYKLREAIHASQFHDRFEQYAKLSEMYTFREKSDHVLAEHSPTAMSLMEVEKMESEEPEPAGPAGPDVMQIPEAESVMQVVNAVLEKGDDYGELRFPNATLLQPHLERLHGFAQDEGWSIITHGEEGVTLTRRDVDDEITWTPNEE